MKKFLSMLLALSVVFTYTFGAAGSVFAAATPTNTQAKYLENLSKAEAQVLETQAAEYELAKATVKHTGDTKYTDGAYSIGGEYWIAQLDALYADTTKAIKAETATLQTAEKYGTYGDKTVEELVALFATDKTAAQLGTALYAAAGDYAFEAAKAQFNEDKATAIENAKSVDTTIYSTTEDEDYAYVIRPYGATEDATYYVAKDFADAVIAKVVATAEAVVLEDTDDTAAEVATKAGNLATTLVVKNATTKKYEIAESVVGQDPYTNNIYILSKDEEAAMKAQNDAAAASKKAKIASNVAIAYSEAVAALTADELTAWNTVKAAYEEVETYLVENTTAAVNTFPVKDTDYTITKNATTGVYEAADKAGGKNYLEVSKRVAELKSLAATLKVAKDLDGNKAYDDAVINKELAKLVKATYEKVTDTTWVYAAPTAAEFAAAALTYVSDFEKNEAKATLANLINSKNNEVKFTAVKDATTLTGASEFFYDLEWKSVEAAVEAYNTAIDAAVTTADKTAAAKALNNAIVVLKDKVAVNALFANTAAKTMGGAANDLTTIANNTVALADSGKAAGATIAAQFIAKYADLHDAGNDNVADVAVTKDDIAVWCAQQGARTLDEVVALKDKLSAEIAALQTADEKKAADDAAVANVKALVAALPTALNATMADAEAAIAAKEAYDDLDAALLPQVTAENTKLAALIYNLKTIYNKAITDKLAEVNKDGAVEIAEKATVDEVVKLHETYVELGAVKLDAVKNAKTDLRTAELANVNKLIKDLPINVSKDDKAAVEAARAAYDAFVAEYTTYDAKNVIEDVYNAAARVANASKLLMAEATLAELTKYTVKDAKLNLYEASKATSYTKPTKNSVALTVKADLTEAKENGYTVKYSFYQKGPKKTTYRLWKTTTSDNYTFKGLKKGTHYFKVKISVYDAEGNLVASKYTNYRYLKIK